MRSTRILRKLSKIGITTFHFIDQNNKQKPLTSCYFNIFPISL